MWDLDRVIAEVEVAADKLLRCREELTPLMRPGSRVPNDDEVMAVVHRLEEHHDALAAILQQVVDFPPRHSRHFQALQQFWLGGGYDESIFVMAKFPDGHDTARDSELGRVLTATLDAVTAAGFTPRFARDARRYHPLLWDNVELHLLGCRRGVAIVEDRHTPELNPNVSMEWGWMRAMGKPVLFLVEEKFTRTRADLGGLLQDTFRWEAPEDTIAPAIQQWLSAGG